METSTIAPASPAASQTGIANIKRTSYLFFYYEDGTFIDIAKLVKGVAELATITQVYAIAILKEQTYPISTDELQVLFNISAEKWTAADDVILQHGCTAAQLHSFAEKGLIVTDSTAGDFAETRRRDEQLKHDQWNIYATLYHFMTKWKDMHLKIELPSELEELKASTTADEEAFGEYIERYGPPPPHFYSVTGALGQQQLPLVKRKGELYDLLMKRQTTRTFDKNKALSQEELSSVLYYVYGCHGLSDIYQDIKGLKKTSPSGGCLHPTEVYPLIINVEGLKPGLYHYNVEHHRLDLLRVLEQDEASELANEFTSGQSYPRSAGALFIMTTRFYRNYWKYRKHQKSYTALLMDAAHLSQTLYMVCTEMGIGAFVTAAINSVNIERMLGLDAYKEGAIAICGCGHMLQSDYSLDPEFYSYTPKR